MIIVELDGSDRAKDDQVRELMSQAGMRRAKSLLTINSEIFLRKDVTLRAQPEGTKGVGSRDRNHFRKQDVTPARVRDALKPD